jgi:hypothetical protein
MKVTVPVGARIARFGPGELAKTFAVSVTDWPAVLGFGLLARLTPEAIFDAGGGGAGGVEVLPWKLASPEYTAEEAPMVVLRLVVEATLSVVLEVSEAVPTDVAPLKNCTVPEGSPSTRPEGPMVMKWTGPPAGGWASATLAATTHCPGNRPVQAPETVVVEGAWAIFRVSGEEVTAA